jgi:isopentenyl-diphosphate delta-isomerase
MIDSQELLFVVDGNNTPITPDIRKTVHTKNLWHRTTGIWVYNSKKQILCQKRSLKKDTKPGYWEAFFGGHVKTSESYEECAAIELSEEIGITVDREKLLFYKIAFSNKLTHKEFQGIYLYRIDRNDTKFTFEKDEIDRIEWIEINRLYNILLTENKADWVHKPWDKEMLDYIQKTDF